MKDYLAGLNEKQREAVEHIYGPLMIVAGAGSGKTKVLTTRIAHLMANGVDSFQILALTFTNKAAKEMKERVEHMLGNGDARNLYIGTFHSVFARILRTEATKMGYPSNFTIYDTDDAKSVLKTVINELNLDDKHYKPNTVYNRISSAKNALVNAEDYANDYGIQQEDMRSNRPASRPLGNESITHTSSTSTRARDTRARVNRKGLCDACSASSPYSAASANNSRPRGLSG